MKSTKATPMSISHYLDTSYTHIVYHLNIGMKLVLSHLLHFGDPVGRCAAAAAAAAAVKIMFLFLFLLPLL